MSTTVATIDLPNDIVQALDEIARTMSLSREESLRLAVTRFLKAERAYQELITSLQTAARLKGIDTEEDLYAFLESNDD